MSTEFPTELCFDYIPPSELEKYVHNVTEFERFALRCCVARRRGRGRPSFGKGKPICYALLVYLRDVAKVAPTLKDLSRVIAELMEKYGIEGPKPATETLKDRFEELRKNPKLQHYVQEILKFIEELKKRGKRRLVLIDRTKIEAAINAWRRGDAELARKLIEQATEWEPLRIRLLNLFERAKPRQWLQEANHIIRYAMVVLRGWDVERLKRLREGKERLPDKVVVSEDELKTLCDPHSFFKYRDVLLAAGYTTDTIRYIVTTLTTICGPTTAAALKGMHGVLVRRGVKKSDEHVIFPVEFKWLMTRPELSDVEKLILKMHVTLGCREGGEYIYYAPGKRTMGGLLGLRWEWVKWKGDLPVAIDVLETKTEKGRKEGTWWLNCPLDLFFDDLPFELRRYWEMKGKPKEGRIFEGWTKTKLQTLYKKVRNLLAKYREECREGKRPPEECPTTAEPKITPHDARRTHALWLVLADVPLEVIAGTGLGKDRIEAPLGVSWKDLTVMMTYYADLVGKAKKYVPRVKEWAKQVFG